MPTPPTSTKTSLQQRLTAHARDRWPDLARIDTRHRGAFAYIDAHLADGDIIPLCRLRYHGSASRWGFAIHRVKPRRLPRQLPPQRPTRRHPRRRTRLRHRALPHQLATRSNTDELTSMPII